MKNRVALVTGASRGLGAAIAKKLAACGARVAVNYFGSEDLARGVVDSIEAAGGTAQVFEADVRDEGAVSRMVGAIDRLWGPVDIVVANATGPQPMLRLEDLSWRACLDQLEFFVKNPVLLAQAVVPKMKQRRYGRFINITSEVFERGVPEFSNYVSAKGRSSG